MVTSSESVPDEVASDKLQKRQSPDSGVHASQSDQEGSSPSVTPEKVSEVGFNWRKYGQKKVKGNEFIRSYYKCTHPNCQVKKQVESSHDGQITDTRYFGKHDHPKPQPSPLMAVGFVLSIQEERPNMPSTTSAEEKSSGAHGQPSHHIELMDVPPISIASTITGGVEGTLSQSNRIRDGVDKDDNSDSKRQKKDMYHVDATLVDKVDKPTGEPRIVVQTLSEVDIVNDGYRWRKYGQKFVKGNSNPRSYYRCSNAGCPVKKHVERASDDTKMVITTYEGQHDHEMPPARTVTHNTAKSNTNATAPNGESRTKSDETSTVGLDMVVYTITVPETKSSEPLNGKSRTRSDEGGTVDLEMVVHTNSGPENKSSEQVNGEPRNKSEKSDTTGLDMVVHTSLGSERKSNDQPNVEFTIELEKVIHVSFGSENKSNEQQTPNAEAVQS